MREQASNLELSGRAHKSNRSCFSAVAILWKKKKKTLEIQFEIGREGNEEEEKETSVGERKNQRKFDAREGGGEEEEHK